MVTNIAPPIISAGFCVRVRFACSPKWEAKLSVSMESRNPSAKNAEGNLYVITESKTPGAFNVSGKVRGHRGYVNTAGKSGVLAAIAMKNDA